MKILRIHCAKMHNENRFRSEKMHNKLTLIKSGPVVVKKCTMKLNFVVQKCTMKVHFENKVQSLCKNAQ